MPTLAPSEFAFGRPVLIQPPPVKHALLSHLVDYAGLFPPASLEFPEAITEYAAHREQVENWMLGRFICPVIRLSELHAFEALFQAGTLRLCILPSPSTSLLEGIGTSAELADEFARSFSGRASVEVIEARVPASAGGDTRVGPETLQALSAVAGDRFLYLEWPISDPGLEDRIGAIGVERQTGCTNLGAKIRCGGVVPEAYPSTIEVARFIHSCVRNAVPFKATAGLHHPVRHERGGVTMHGFLNVFTAAVLGRVHDLDQVAIEAIIAETDSTAFDLAGGGVTWRGWSAGPDQVHAVRGSLAHSYGSCSFDDPVHDLKARNWFQARALDS
jgi:hypothetical protein